MSFIERCVTDSDNSYTSLNLILQQSVSDLKPHFNRYWGWVAGCSGGSGDRLVEMGKHSWGHTALVGLRLNGLLHTFISVFAQGMCLNLHTLFSARSLPETQPARMKVTPSTATALLIPPWLNLNVLHFIKVHKGHIWICVWVNFSVGGISLIIYTE